MDVFLQEENIKKKQRNENRERKRRLKRFLKAQEGKFAGGGHDKSGTRVTDETPLRKPVSGAMVSNTISYGSNEGEVTYDTYRGVSPTPENSPQDLAMEAPPVQMEAGVGTDGLLLDLDLLPSKPTRDIPIDSKRPLKARACHILKNEHQVLGQGAFGKVFMGISTITGELVAIKEIAFRNEKKEAKKQIEKLVREMGLMRAVAHPNIVRYYGAERCGKTLQIFMEYVPGGSLKSIVRRFGKLHEAMMKMYLRQILHGLAYLHEADVLHLDIKSDNALLGVTGEVKLADFGTSSKLEDCSRSKEVVGTPAFMAPEVIRGTGYSSPADVWSVGITIHELLVGDPPTFGMSDPLALMYRIASSASPPEPPENTSPECKEFLKHCLQRHPLDRLTAAELLAAPYMRAADEDEEEEGSPQHKNTALPTMAIVEHTDDMEPPLDPQHMEAEEEAKAPAAFDGPDEADPDREKDRPVLHGSAHADTRAIEAFVEVSGKKAVTNDKADLTYLRTLGKLKRRGLLSDFEVNTKKSALFGMKAFEPLKPCGLSVEDLKDDDIIDL